MPVFGTLPNAPIRIAAKRVVLSSTATSLEVGANGGAAIRQHEPGR